MEHRALACPAPPCVAQNEVTVCEKSWSDVTLARQGETALLRKLRQSLAPLGMLWRAAARPIAHCPRAEL